LADQLRNVGLFKYWTVSNLPLFLLAAPMLVLLIWSSATSCIQTAQKSAKTEKGASLNHQILRRLALPQLVVSVLALTTFHVQIVNRISSGYILWYLYLAQILIQKPSSLTNKTRDWTKIGVRSMICYGIIQTGLFTAFLPPA
jgi:phosphatidylinositol glycan class V